jgi:3-deoxy-D-manno-octulosonic-acid transferase
VWNFADIYAALDGAHGAERVVDTGRLTARLAALMMQPAARQNVADNAHATVSGLSGALERTLHAIEPYFMQLRLLGPDA